MRVLPDIKMLVNIHHRLSIFYKMLVNISYIIYISQNVSKYIIDYLYFTKF